MTTPRRCSRRARRTAAGCWKHARHAAEWIVPPDLAATVHALIDAADRIDDPALAYVWTDHLPVAVLACLERRSLARRLADGDPFVVSAGA